MKLKIIYGDYTTAILNRLSKVKEDLANMGFKIIALDCLDPEVAAKLRTEPIFGDMRVVFLENFGKCPGPLVNFLLSPPGFNFDIYAWEEGVISQKILKKLGDQAEVEFFKTPKEIFKFSESIYPGNSKEIARFLKKLQGCEQIEFVIGVIVRHLRMLLSIKKNKTSSIVPGWQRKKLENIAVKFSNNLLAELFDEIEKIDRIVKTGAVDKNSAFTLLDLTLIRKLN